MRAGNRWLIACSVGWLFLLAASLAHVRCVPATARTKIAGVNITTSPLGRHSCSPALSAAGATVAALTLDVLRKRGELAPGGDPVHVCVVAGAEGIWCSGAFVQGCALPYKGGPRVYVAGAAKPRAKQYDAAGYWRLVLAREIVLGLATTRGLKGWPRSYVPAVASKPYAAAIAAVRARLP